MTAPLRVGVLNDMSAGPPLVGDIEPWLRFTADQLIANGRIDRPVEFVHAWGPGLGLGLRRRGSRARCSVSASRTGARCTAATWCCASGGTERRCRFRRRTPRLSLSSRSSLRETGMTVQVGDTSAFRNPAQQAS